MRHILHEEHDGYVLMSRQRELVSYYANSIAHVLGPYEVSVRARDALPSATIPSPITIT